MGTLERMKYFLALLPILLFGADQKYAGDTPARHQEIEKHFLSNPDEASIWDRKLMTGSWGDIRSKLAKKGVVITSSLVNDMAANPVGGRSRGFRQVNSFAADLRADFGTIFGLKGFSFYTSSCIRSGQSLSNDTIDNIFQVQQLFGSQNFRFSSLYLQQDLWDNRIILRAGRLTMADTFMGSPLYGKFMSGAINGTPITMFSNGVFTSFPVATWGAYMFVEPVERFSMKFAVYNANKTLGKNKSHGANFTFKSTEGALLMTQIGYHPNTKKNDEGWPGNYSFGAYYFTGDREKFETGEQTGNFGYYFMFDQMLYRAGKSNLKTFMTFNLTPSTKVAQFPFFYGGGLVYQGLIPWRTEDTTSAAVFYGTFSKELRRVQQRDRSAGVMGKYGNIPQNFETTMELNHVVQVNQWWYIMPNVQLVINPKGLGKYADALVLGTEVGLTF